MCNAYGYHSKENLVINLLSFWNFPLDKKINEKLIPSWDYQKYINDYINIRPSDKQIFHNLCVESFSFFDNFHHCFLFFFVTPENTPVRKMFTVINEYFTRFFWNMSGKIIISFPHKLAFFFYPQNRVCCSLIKPVILKSALSHLH